MPSALHHLILDRIRERGPLTAAEFIDLALYHPAYGYYSTAAQRSGRQGDFITSVDAGSLFGEMLALQLEEMWHKLGRPAAFEAVDAGAGNGRLTRDILEAARRSSRSFYGALRVSLVERSAAARAAQAATLGPHAGRVVRSLEDLPASIEGVIIANELLDAMPVHVAVMTRTGLREIHIAADGDRLCEIEDELSTPLIAEHLARSGARLEAGARVEVGLHAAAWIARAGHSLRRGFLVIVDYASDSRRPSVSDTLAASRAHVCTDEWFRDPGERDITAHVSLPSIRHEAEKAGFVMLGATDQTYFLLGLGMVERLSESGDPQSIARRRTAKSLLLPEGLGGTQKVLVFGKEVGHPALRGLSQRRLT